MEAFAARGDDGAPVDEIAAAADVTKPVLYDHIASKRDLFVAVMEAPAPARALQRIPQGTCTVSPSGGPSIRAHPGPHS